MQKAKVGNRKIKMIQVHYTFVKDLIPWTLLLKFFERDESIASNKTKKMAYSRTACWPDPTNQRGCECLPRGVWVCNHLTDFSGLTSGAIDQRNAKGLLLLRERPDKSNAPNLSEPYPEATGKWQRELRKQISEKKQVIKTRSSTSKNSYIYIYITCI